MLLHPTQARYSTFPDKGVGTLSKMCGDSVHEYGGGRWGHVPTTINRGVVAHAPAHALTQRLTPRRLA